MSSYKTDVTSGLPNELVTTAQNLCCYLRKDYSKKLNVMKDGIAVHNSCISHCLPHAFGNCQEMHYNSCMDCKNLFIFFRNLKDHLPSNLHRNLDEYQKKLIAFMSHHACKVYLNAQLPATLSQLGSDEALIIVDYKMRINPKKARETKDEWFGKREWTLHSVLLYIKNQNTASSLHGVIETLKRKPKSVTIISDNGGHYHNTDENYISKTRKQKIGTIAGICNWNKFTWAYDGEEASYIYARLLPKFGEIDHQGNKIFYTSIFKYLIIKKPKILFLHNIHIDTIDENLEELTNKLEYMNITSEAEENLECKDWEVFISGWALQQHQKIRESVKRIPIHIKQLLKTMFHAGTANPGKKISAA
ncbi:hypothetical protein GLOIN_2v1790442 [Rhizophagus clarus]|uniref:C2H2-type domain-containing protein n=1 Tax=Rhizophagus clarus TaxID=94130 RepID=A0A8H3M3Q6_9GLOM|nr:hypothetical protein GLOIN_2v1790442 [Rhizophagus clarus]